MRASQAQQRQLNTGIELQVKTAQSHRSAANQRIEVAQPRSAWRREPANYKESLRHRTHDSHGSVAQRNRATETRSRLLAAIYDARLAATAVELAAGVLSADSEVLK